MAAPRFLMWYDDNPKLTIANKIGAAISAYNDRFRGAQPNVVLVNEAEVVALEGVQVRGLSTIGRNNYWVGLEQRELATGTD